MDLIASLKKSRQLGHVVEAVRADHGYAVQGYRPQERVARKGIAFHHRHAHRHDIAFLGLSLGIFQQANKYRFAFFGSQRRAKEHVARRGIACVFGRYCNGSQIVGIAEGTIPDGGNRLGLSLSHEPSEGDGFHKFVAIEGVAIKRRHLIGLIVVGHKVGDHHVHCLALAGIEGIIALLRFLTDKRRPSGLVQGVIHAVCVVTSVQYFGDVHRSTAEFRAPVLCRVVDDHVDPRIGKGGCLAHRSQGRHIAEEEDALQILAAHKRARFDLGHRFADRHRGYAVRACKGAGLDFHHGIFQTICHDLFGNRYHRLGGARSKARHGGGLVVFIKVIVPNTVTVVSRAVQTANALRGADGIVDYALIRG